VHQSRASLDNLVELLNIRECGKPTPGTQFPIYHERDQYLHGHGIRRPGVERMGSVGADAAQLIESLQPYHWGNAYRNHPLWILNALWNADKHRQPTVVIAAWKTIDVSRELEALTAEPMIGREDIIAAERIPLVDGAEVARVRIGLTDKINTSMYVKSSLDFILTFGKDSPAVGREVYPTLAECFEYVNQALMKFGEFF
jgi:hypothetical protein